MKLSTALGVMVAGVTVPAIMIDGTEEFFVGTHPNILVAVSGLAIAIAFIAGEIFGTGTK